MCFPQQRGGQPRWLSWCSFQKAGGACIPGCKDRGPSPGPEGAAQHSLGCTEVVPALRHGGGPSPGTEATWHSPGCTEEGLALVHGEAALDVGMLVVLLMLLVMYSLILSDEATLLV